MVYCPNPKCKHRQHSATAKICQNCDTSLTLNNCYRLIQPLINLEQFGNTELFEVEDQRWVDQPHKCRKVMKILRYNGGDLERLFKQEASHLQTLDHPAVPKIYPEDRSDEGYFSISVPANQQDVYYFVMEKIEGFNLRNWIEKHAPIDSSTLLQWLRELLTVLNYLHKNRIWHRDIKPSNIMLKPDGQLVLIDFGAVKQVRLHRQEGAELSNRPDITVTETGIFSAGYTSPEQMDCKTVQQSDLYALGRTCVHLLTKMSPHALKVDDSGQLTWRHKAPDVSPPLADWIDRLMSPLVCDRPQTAAQVLGYLHSNRIIPPPKRRVPVWLYLLNLALFVVLIISSVFWWQADQRSQPTFDQNQQSSIFDAKS